MKETVDPESAGISETTNAKSGVIQKQESVYRPALRELLDWLCRSRKRLAIIYFGILAVWMGLMFYYADPSWPNEMISPSRPIFKYGERQPAPAKTIAVIIGVFCLMQGAFLFGGGKLRV